MNPVRPSVSFIVPALNEASHVENTVKTIIEAVAESQVGGYEIVLVDDGSTDGTGEIMDRLAGATSHTRAVHNQRNLGFGSAYKQGVAAARCDYVMIVAGDNIMTPASIAAVLNRLGDADIILPYMTDRHRRPFVRRIGSWAYAQVINTLFGYRIRYYNSMVPRRELLNRITINTSGYSLQAECIVKLLRGGATFVEVGVPHGFGVAKSGSHAVRPKNLMNLFKSILALIREIRSYTPPPLRAPKREP